MSSSIYVENNDPTDPSPAEDGRKTTAELKLVNSDGTNWLTMRITTGTEGNSRWLTRFEVEREGVTQTYDARGLRDLQRAIDYFLPDGK